jgi:hypothetical protein
MGKHNSGETSDKVDCIYSGVGPTDATVFGDTDLHPIAGASAGSGTGSGAALSAPNPPNIVEPTQGEASATANLVVQPPTLRRSGTFSGFLEGMGESAPAHLVAAAGFNAVPCLTTAMGGGTPSTGAATGGSTPGTSSGALVIDPMVLLRFRLALVSLVNKEGLTAEAAAKEVSHPPRLIH